LPGAPIEPLDPEVCAPAAVANAKAAAKPAIFNPVVNFMMTSLCVALLSSLSLIRERVRVGRVLIVLRVRLSVWLRHDGAMLVMMRLSLRGTRLACARALATLAAGFARFLGSELVRGAFLMRGAAPLAGYFALLIGRHPRKTPVGAVPIGHERFSSKN
jgi:hypothetical protein